MGRFLLVIVRRSNMPAFGVWQRQMTPVFFDMMHETSLIRSIPESAILTTLFRSGTPT
jgi:hypothetical protein